MSWPFGGGKPMTATPELELLPSDPTRIGPYLLLGRLGEGGSSVVFLGQRPDGQRAAVKVLKNDSDDPVMLRSNFESELVIARRVPTTCTAVVLDAELGPGRWWIAYEYIPGRTLRELVAESGALPTADVAQVATVLAMALESVHAAGFAHLDVTPSNIIMSRVGPKLVDFGTAQIIPPAGIIEGFRSGTRGFMAPERAASGTVSKAVDVFGWGAVVVFAATGDYTFEDPAPENTPASLPDDLRVLVGRTLAAEPARRPDISTVLALLLEHVHHHVEPAPPTSGLRVSPTSGIVPELGDSWTSDLSGRRIPSPSEWSVPVQGAPAGEWTGTQVPGPVFTAPAVDGRLVGDPLAEAVSTALTCAVCGVVNHVTIFVETITYCVSGHVLAVSWD
ncbi:Serine/threonine protein kinase [Frankia sp. Hr75.2]|nr:Serine/threonine protein kinase [Frankia sp. Hr75.2]